jgi:putative transposase
MRRCATMTTEPIEQVRTDGLDNSVTDEQLIAMLVERTQGDRLKLTGEGGLLQKLTKRVLESALEGEITDHVGYD